MHMCAAHKCVLVLWAGVDTTLAGHLQKAGCLASIQRDLDI